MTRVSLTLVFNTRVKFTLVSTSSLHYQLKFLIFIKNKYMTKGMVLNYGQAMILGGIEDKIKLHIKLNYTEM